MSDKFITLDCDDDVVLLQKDTFKVTRLKNILKDIIGRKLYYHYIHDNENKNLGNVDDFLRSTTIGETFLRMDEFQFHSTQDCQLLQLGGKGWQKGKLKIQISVTKTSKYNGLDVYIQFSSDEPEETESPL